MKKKWGAGILAVLLAVVSLTVGMTMTVAADNEQDGSGRITAFADDDGTGNWTWASKFIYACAEKGIISGFPDQTFHIEEGLTREQAAKIIAEAFQLPEVNGTVPESNGDPDSEEPGKGAGTLLSADFADGDSIQPWAVPYVERCVQAGVIKGYEDGTFRPQNTVTRAEFCKLISSAAKLSGEKGKAAFRDDDGAGSWSWASAGIYACYRNGIIGGYGDGDFLPANPVTRGQASKIIAIAGGLAEPEQVTEYQKYALATAETLIAKGIYSFNELVNVLAYGNGYMVSEAIYAAINCGADWTDMAMKRAASILEDAGTEGITRDDFVKLMTDQFGFTSGQTEYAAEHCGAKWKDPVPPDMVVQWQDFWQWAGNSKIHNSSVMLYRAKANRKNIVVAVNAGHGTSGGTSVKTLCHPDGSAKVTGGSTSAGSTYAAAINEGTTLSGNTPERVATLKLALLVKADLLNAGYDVLMLRETDDVRLDNLARTIMANNAADCHIAIHYDSTSSSKGLFYCSVPNNSRYRNMEPVKSHWREHEALGQAILAGMRQNGVKIWNSGTLETDLTQTSYSTVPSAVVEVGDKTSSRSDAALASLSAGFVKGVDLYFGK